MSVTSSYSFRIAPHRTKGSMPGDRTGVPKPPNDLKHRDLIPGRNTVTIVN